MKVLQKIAALVVILVGLGMVASNTEAGQNMAAYTRQVLNTGALVYGATDNQGATLVGNGASTVLDVAVSSVVQSGPGRVGRVSVLVAGAAGAVYDVATAASATAANEIAVIPATQGVVTVDFPFTTGLVYIPGASQVVSISYNK